MPQCQGIKRDGGRCTVIVAPSESYCYHHSPKRAEERRRNASRGGQSKGGGSEISDLKAQLRKLAADVLAGEVGRSEAAVVNQILNTRARLIELERRIREQEELEERLGALEDVLKRRTG
jgi:uncharacterized protein DUF5763